jgi:4-carboxymuconolactone decarboxylase
VPASALSALDAGEPLPSDLSPDLALASTFASELIGHHRLSDETWNDASKLWDVQTLVELLTLVGYFATVCWLMNVARTPGLTT